jgi:glycosyltransferase involved in cell wall biosynthesis
VLAEGLVARGVDVTLFATLDSLTSAKLAGVCERPYGEDASLDGRICEALHVAYALEHSAAFDLVHNHLDWLPLAFARLWGAPLLTTVHGFSGPKILPAYVHAEASSFVAISDADREPQLSYLATVHHGVRLEQLPFSRAGGESLVVFGRIHPDKGTATAIEIARRAGRPLVICGIVQDEAYFRERVAPHIDGTNVSYLGSVGPEQRASVLGGALALLHPIAFPEPFGLSVVEAMACGTPVIAYPLGSMREVIDVGVTGYLVEDVAAAVAAVPRAAELDRQVVRRTAERRFSAERMVDDYLKLYRQLLAK